MCITSLSVSLIILFHFAFTANNTLQVDNTDAEGRLLLADALCYAHSFSPSTIIDLATLTGAIDVALGSGASAVFTTSDSLWTDLQEVLYNYMYNVYNMCFSQDKRKEGWGVGGFVRGPCAYNYIYSI